MMSSPIAIGGIGGSGTRVIAAILIELAYSMGDDLNQANDNLAFTLLFKRLETFSSTDTGFRQLADIFVAGMTNARPFTTDEEQTIRQAVGQDRAQHPMAWLMQRADALLARSMPDADKSTRWGWKEPNTHVFLDRLYASIPRLKYIHVARNGLDMAYSGNQNQPRLWGRTFLGGEDVVDVTPHYSLKYWCAVHRRILRIAETAGKQECFLLLNFDRLCQAPLDELHKLFAFLGIAPDANTTERCMAMIKTPASVGRGRIGGLDVFDPADVAYVAELGFDI